MSSALEGRFLTTGPPGSPVDTLFICGGPSDLLWGLWTLQGIGWEDGVAERKEAHGWGWGWGWGGLPDICRVKHDLVTEQQYISIVFGN